MLRRIFAHSMRMESLKQRYGCNKNNFDNHKLNLNPINEKR